MIQRMTVKQLNKMTSSSQVMAPKSIIPRLDTLGTNFGSFIVTGIWDLVLPHAIMLMYTIRQIKHLFNFFFFFQSKMVYLGLEPCFRHPLPRQ